MVAAAVCARRACEGGNGEGRQDCRRRAAWPRQRPPARRLRPAPPVAAAPAGGRPEPPPLWVVFQDFVSEEERLRLLASAVHQRETGLLLPNPAGPLRYFRRLDHTNGVDDFLEELTRRFERHVVGLAGQPLDVALGRVCSYIEPGGSIHEHDDEYAKGSKLEGFGHLRANIVVQLEPSSLPIIERQPVPVNEKDAWIFLASHSRHATAMVRGPRPRIVFGFGWTVQPGFRLAAAR